jgi:hypothetical protein
MIQLKPAVADAALADIHLLLALPVKPSQPSPPSLDEHPYDSPSDDEVVPQLAWDLLAAAS